MDENIWLDLTLGSVLRAEGSDGVAVRAATSPTDARALQILMALLKGNVEMWEVHGVANAALAAVRASKDEPLPPPVIDARGRLVEKLLERGFFEAGDAR